MVIYYTALGMLNRFDVNGNEAEVEYHGKKFELDMPAFIIWTSLMWNVYQYDDLEKVFEVKCKKYKVIPDFEFDYYMQSLELMGIIKSGKGCTAITALYTLLLNLHICPINYSLIGRVKTFVGSLIKKVPVKIAAQAFEKIKIDNPDERKVWELICQADLSVSEAICCVVKGITEIEEDSIIEKIYGEKYDYKTIGAYALLSDDKYKIIDAIVGLYQKKMIIFEN